MQALQVLQQAEPTQTQTPTPALPPFRAWTNLLRNELATDLGGRTLGTNVGGAPCATLTLRASSSRKTRRTAAIANLQGPLVLQKQHTIA